MGLAYTPTAMPSATPPPTFTSQPTHTAPPTTTFPTLQPTDSSEFKWQAGIYYEGGNINSGTTKIYNVYYGNWNNPSFYRCDVQSYPCLC